MFQRLALAATACALCLAAQTPDNAAMQSKLRAEETAHSQVMEILHQITDVHGPRLTGSPGLKAADDWAVATMSSWGLANAHLEGWNFGHPGWANALVEANVLVPYQAPLEVRPLAWSPGTRGAITAPAVLLTVPGLHASAGRRGSAEEQAAAQAGSDPPPMPAPEAAATAPTLAELDAYLNTMREKVRGAIVLAGAPVHVDEVFFPAPLRTPDEQWQARFSGQGGGRGGFGGRGRGGAAPDPTRLTPEQVDFRVTQFLAANGAVARVNDAGEAYGIIRAQDVSGYNEAPQVTGLLMSHQDYARLARVLADGSAAQVRINVENHFYPDGTTAYNAVGEIPGSDKADEVVMLGGHYDSWAGSTGATDNGAGSAIMLEAIRLLKATGVQPRRTIRVALWSGEEEGLLGSTAYVEQHFGTAEHPKPEWSKLDAYLNIDSGTGKPRGAGVFGPPEAADFIADALSGFRDWGFYGASASGSRAPGGTDSTSFNHAGLPGIGFSQDRFDYGTYTHHTNFDSYERLFEPDLREAAVEAAAAAYALAMAPEMLPRFPASAMPPIQEGAPWPARLQGYAQRAKEMPHQ
ncbi:MAG TPA: M20/M25/M40 family metallo-hydrolase [Terriglobales bacterium]|nr:M20/M25/M40 family metallo-hydrolase [Terriglobales bacterium]